MSSREPATLDDAALLDAWERMLAVPRPWREVTLLTAAHGGSADEIAHLPIGERDRLLLELREHTLGTHMECETACPMCHTQLEWTQDTSALRLPARTAAHTLRLAGDAYSVSCRLPDSADLAACRGLGNAADALMERCARVVDSDGTFVDINQLVPALRELVEAHISRLDPQAEMLMDLCCPRCEHRWQATFDPAAFVLEEIDACARRLLGEVHELARAYGWREADILAMGRSRRRRYLELVLQ